MLNKIKNLSKWQWFVFMFFLVFFVIGMFIFRDYGVTGDEKIERNHSIVTHYYLKSIMNGKTNMDGIPTFALSSNIEKMVDREKIQRKFFEYEYKYYGIGIQLPYTLIEQSFNYRLDYPTIYYIRHFGNFLIYFISLIYFYQLLKKFIIKDEKIALIGTLFLILSPRLFGHAFFNIKDSVFMSLSIINIYYCLLYLKEKKLKNLLLLSLISAFNTNCRIIGGIFIFMTFIFNICENIKNKKQLILSSLLMIGLTYGIYILITPAAWNNIIKFPIEVIDFFFNFSDPNSHLVQKCLYFGNIISSEELPWHYIPVWIFITTPLVYILFSLFGFLKELVVTIKNKFKNIDKDWLFCNIIIIIVFAFIMISNPTLYTGWRHFYFIYPIIIINALVALKYLLKLKKYQKIIISILIANSVYISGWMVLNHPYEYEYFSLFTRKYAVRNFDTNYWATSNNEAVEYIKNIEKGKVEIYSINNTSDLLLKEKDRKKVQLVQDVKKADYIIDNSKYGNKKYKEKYKEIKTKKIQGYRLYTIYKK